MKTQKIVISRSYSGFVLTEAMANRYNDLYNENFGTDLKAEDLYAEEIPRDDPMLIQVVNELGEGSGLKVVEIPEDVKWKIHDYDGIESIHEIHRIWY